MAPDSTAYARAIALIDAANQQDPNEEIVDGQGWPKERLYSERMSEMLERFAPQADEAMRIAVRAQHIQRWRSPRTDYPAGRQGYLQWRTALYRFHAETVARLMAEAGCGEEQIERVRQAVGKRARARNADTQLLEDVAALVFLEHYLLEFAHKHPEYDEEKWLDIIRKTWRKMSEPAHRFALSGALSLPEPLLPLIRKAVAGR